MVIRMRHTRSHTANRRSHHALKAPRFSKCAKCSTMVIRHTACANCGTYRGRQVIDVMAKLSKKERKDKEKQLAAKEGAK